MIKLEALSFLCVRVISIYLFFQGLNQIVALLQFSLPTYLQLIEPGVGIGQVIVTAGLPASLMIICSVVIWFSATKLAKLFLPPSIRESGETIHLKGIEAFVLSMIGLIILIISTTTLIRLALSYFDAAALSDSLNMSNRAYLYPLVEHLIRVIVGLALLIKAEGFSMFLTKVRSLGLQRQQEN